RGGVGPPVIEKRKSWGLAGTQPPAHTPRAARAAPPPTSIICSREASRRQNFPPHEPKKTGRQKATSPKPRGAQAPKSHTPPRAGSSHGAPGRLAPAPAPAPPAAPAPSPPPTPSPPPPSGGGRSGRCQRQSGYSNRCGELRADGSDGVRRQHGDHGETTNYDSPGLCEDASCH